MLLINLATIYQGTLSTLRHTRTRAQHLFRIHLRYTLTGELDPSVPSIVQELHITHPILPWTLNPTAYNTHAPTQRHNTKRNRNPTHTTQYPQTLIAHTPKRPRSKSNSLPTPLSTHTHAEPPLKRRRFLPQPTHTPATPKTPPNTNHIATLKLPVQTRGPRARRRTQIRHRKTQYHPHNSTS
jgi:hypothetical protein